METLGLYEPEELSLFGGEQLLMGLGSPLEPDTPITFPDLRDDTTSPALLGPLPCGSKAVKHGGTSSTMATNHSFKGGSTGLETGWMDTSLDLLSLLQDTQPNLLDIGLSEANSNDLLATVKDVVPTVKVFSPTTQPASAEDLFNQMSENLSTDDPAVEQDLLTEILTNLTDYINQDDVDKSSLTLPHLDSEMLSPVSVNDIESLLSESDIVMDSTLNDSGLESLMSSRAESPVTDLLYKGDPDYAPTTKSKKRSQRSTPYERLPRDKKERKKIQNKTAALKYRQKKREEGQKVNGDVGALETRNKELKDKVESMTREIQYLKDLMAEVLKARGKH